MMGKSNTTIESSSAGNKFIGRVTSFGKPVILTVMLTVVPTLYHYSNNVHNLTLVNLSRMLIFNIAVAVIFYLVFLVFTKFRPVRAAISTFVFLIFFNIYGLLYRYLLNLELIRIEHYTLLPLVILLAIYLIRSLLKLNDRATVKLWNSLALMVGVLVLFNLINIFPAEIKRWDRGVKAESLQVKSGQYIGKTSPDIYYIIFDEFAGFQAMREYWHYDGVDDLASFLKSKGFFVAEASHSITTDTLRETAARLNYQEYPKGSIDVQTLFDDRANNRVIQYLKSHGYTIVAFDEVQMAYPAATPVQADYLYAYGSPVITQAETQGYGLYFDEFGELVVDNTMLYALSDLYKKNSPVVRLHNNMISFTLEHIVDKEIPSPKFVFVHLLLPHEPFMFNQKGEIVASEYFSNWYHYIENYIYSISVLKRMIVDILSSYDPKNPPVIIIQSDHGARNDPGPTKQKVILPDYPEEFKSLILNALLIPGYDFSDMPQDMNPVNTFPIIFNYLYGDQIPLKN